MVEAALQATTSRLGKYTVNSGGSLGYYEGECGKSAAELTVCDCFAEHVSAYLPLNSFSFSVPSTMLLPLPKFYSTGSAQAADTYQYYFSK
jgi:hypothetical protein